MNSCPNVSGYCFWSTSANPFTRAETRGGWLIDWERDEMRWDGMRSSSSSSWIKIITIHHNESSIVIIIIIMIIYLYLPKKSLLICPRVMSFTSSTPVMVSTIIPERWDCRVHSLMQASCSQMWYRRTLSKLPPMDGYMHGWIGWIKWMVDKWTTLWIGKNLSSIIIHSSNYRLTSPIPSSTCELLQ